LAGVWMTKDFGLNWTKLRIPAAFTGLLTAPSNDDQKADYDPLASGGTLGGQGNYDVALAIDPTNPSVVYLSGLGGGSSNGKAFGTIRIDTTLTSDAHALVPYDNSNNDGGTQQFNSTGGVSVKNGGTSLQTGLLLGRGRDYGLLEDMDVSYLNMLRDP